MTTQDIRPRVDWGSLFNNAFGIAFVGIALGMVFRKPDYSSLEEELADLNWKIAILVDRVEQQKEAVRGTREYKVRLMKEYGLTVLPPLEELRRTYRPLYNTERYLQMGERRLDNMELGLLLKHRRRKEIMVKLGMKPEEEPPRPRFPAMKKFIPPPGMEKYR